MRPTRALPLVVALAAATLLSACGGDRAGEPVEVRPNVVLIVLDTLRTDHLSAYGYPWTTTPRLDALAEDGVLFLDCTAQASWTMPSMISLMTSLPIFATIYRIPDEVPMLAERFAAADYRTAAFVANSLVSADAGFARGFERFEAREILTPQWRGEQVSDRALAFLEEDDDRPFFLWLHYLDPHEPYKPPEIPFERDAATVFEDFELAEIDAAIDAAPEAERARLRYQRDPLAREVDRYDGELLYLDAQIGRVLDALAARGLTDSTYVLVAADHGETLFRRRENPDRVATVREYRTEQGEPMRLSDYVKAGHDGTVFEELIRTPLIVAGPEIVAGRRVEALVSNLDVGPTLLGFAGLAPDPGPGRDLSSALRDGTPVPDAAWVTSSCGAAIAAKWPGGGKLVLPSDAMRQRFGHEPARYDLESDPFELAPLPWDDVAEPWRARLLDARDADVFGAFGGEGLDEETRERMRELGYLR